MVSRRVLLCALIALAVASAFALAGCKYSDVLTEHIEDPEAALDENAEPTHLNVPDAPKDPDRANTSIDDADDEDTQIEALPHYDPGALDNGPTKQLKHTDQTPHDEAASEGTEEGGGDSDESEGEDGDEGDDEGQDDPIESEDSDEATDPTSGGDGGSQVIGDDDGTTSEAAKGTVAAVGEYATITQMLGGPGSLLATSQSWLDSVPEGVFPDELDNVKVGWTGDGTASGSTQIDALINDIKPNVVLWDGIAPALTEDDKAKLEAAGITVQAVPHIGEPNTEDAEVQQAVLAVASVLEGSMTTKYAATDMRASWVDFHRSVLQSCYDANEGAYAYKAADASDIRLYQDTPLSGFGNSSTNRVTTAYVDGWWDAAPSSMTLSQSITTSNGEVVSLSHDGQTVDSSEGVGLSTKTSSNSYMVLDYYLQFSGIVNNAYDQAKPVPSGKSYLIMPGSASTLSTSSFQNRSGVDSALWYNSGDASVKANWKALGDSASAFPALLVNGEAEVDIAAKITASAAKANGLYHMDDPYKVMVVPSGVAGNWAYGSTESFLVAPWSLRMRDESTATDAANLVSQYYSYFYRCSDWTKAVKNWDSVSTAG